MNNWKVYLLTCADDTLYCGITNDLESRLKAHNAGKGAKYTKGRAPVVLAAVGPDMNKGDALRCEMAIKKLSASRKIDALKKYEVG